jgi:hypothetical protein
MTGEHVIWCTREEWAGNAPLDIRTSPPAFRHHRHGWCPCGQEHGRSLAHLGLAPLQLTRPDSSPPASSCAPHEIYVHALGLLGLRDDAIRDLTRRGLDLDAITQAGYRSVPLDLRERRSFLDKLARRFSEDELRACPGFTDKNGHLYFWTGAAYVVPYRNERGRITGLQCKQLGGKYLTARGRFLLSIGGSDVVFSCELGRPTRNSSNPYLAPVTDVSKHSAS